MVLRSAPLTDETISIIHHPAAMSKQAIIHMIVGEHVDLETMRPPAKALGDRVAVIDSLKGGTIRNFSAEFSRGEVVGLTGLIGSGYDEIVYMAFGAVPAAAGTLALGDRTFELPELTPPDAIEGGCILIPGDRQGAGCGADPRSGILRRRLPQLPRPAQREFGSAGRDQPRVGASEFEAHAECHVPCQAF